MTIDTPRGRRWAASPLDVVLWLLLVFLLAPVLAALDGLPWAQRLPAWTVPVAVLGGLGVGALLVLGTLSATRWWAAIPLLGLAVAAGALISARGTANTPAPVGTLLLGAFAASLGAALPWLVLRVRQTWLALVLIWLTVAGAWGGQLSPRQGLWLVWLLVGTLLLLGLSHLREEVAAWQAHGLQRIGPVLWPSARAAMALSLLAALLGLVPLGAVQLASLSAWWHELPIARGGPLAFDSPSGTPVAVLGAPLTMNAPDVTSSQVVLTYRLVNVPTVPSGAPFVIPPLLGTTFDTFDGTTWTQSGQAMAVPAAAFAAADKNSLLTAAITVHALPESERATYLLGFDEPVSFSVPARAAILAGETPSPVSLVDWEAASSLAAGTTYTSSSLAPPSGTQPAAGGPALSAASLARLTAMPASLAAELRAVARGWIGAAAVQPPLAQAQALLTALQAHAALDPHAAPAPAMDPISGFLRSRRGNALLYTTTYVLLGRALGLPLRLAEGYLPGTFDPHLNAMVVRASDAAVWAQLALPGVGWQDLFPASTSLTVLVPGKIVYSGAPAAQPTPAQPTPSPRGSSNPTSPREARQGAISSSALVIGGFILLILLVLAGLAALASLRWSRIGVGLPPLTQLFARIAVLARLAGIRLRPSDTAAQATAKVAIRLPEQADLLGELNHQYERMRYGPPGERGFVGNLQAQWQRLRAALGRLIVARVWRRPPW